MNRKVGYSQMTRRPLAGRRAGYLRAGIVRVETEAGQPVLFGSAYRRRIPPGRDCAASP
jgi:hypothetical protein